VKTNNAATTNNKTQKPSEDIRNSFLFTDITSQEEVFVRGGKIKVVAPPERKF
jgi:hypothetical protein